MRRALLSCFAAIAFQACGGLLSDRSRVSDSQYLFALDPNTSKATVFGIDSEGTLIYGETATLSGGGVAGIQVDSASGILVGAQSGSSSIFTRFLDRSKAAFSTAGAGASSQAPGVAVVLHPTAPYALQLGYSAGATYVESFAINRNDGTLSSGGYASYGVGPPSAFALNPQGDRIVVSAGTSMLFSSFSANTGVVGTPSNCSPANCPVFSSPSLSFHPDGQAFYGIESGSTTLYTLSNFVGSTTTVNTASALQGTGYVVKAHPRGEHVVVASSYGLECYRVLDRSTGAISSTPVSVIQLTGLSPTDLAFDRDGDFGYMSFSGGLYAFGLDSNGILRLLKVSSYVTDLQHTGKLAVYNARAGGGQ